MISRTTALIGCLLLFGACGDARLSRPSFSPPQEAPPTGRTAPNAPPPAAAGTSGPAVREPSPTTSPAPFHFVPEASEPQQAALALDPSYIDPQLTAALFRSEIDESHTRQLAEWLDLAAKPSDNDHEAPKLEQATSRSIKLLDACLASVKEGQNQRDFPNTLVNLATELRYRMSRTKGELAKELQGLRESDYRDATARLQKLDGALANAEGTTATTLARLKKAAQDKVGALEDQAEMLDRSITALTEKDRRIGQAILLWTDRSTIVMTSQRDCAILRDDFVSLFRPEHR